jgi:hypothetical protein
MPPLERKSLRTPDFLQPSLHRHSGVVTDRSGIATGDSGQMLKSVTVDQNGRSR